MKRVQQTWVILLVIVVVVALVKLSTVEKAELLLLPLRIKRSNENKSFVLYSFSPINPDRTHLCDIYEDTLNGSMQNIAMISIIQFIVTKYRILILIKNTSISTVLDVVII